MELLDKKVIVTGGASGFGLGIVKKFLNNGAKVVIADQNKTLADEQAQKLGSNAFSIETDVSNLESIVLAQEEIFGPVQVLIPFKDEEEAMRIANGTKFGLVAGIWTKDGSRQMRMAKQLKAGQVFVNNYGAGGGVELPFGGVGHSGFGREKGFEALKGFSVIKTVAVNHG